jgi:hypothetical protein
MQTGNESATSSMLAANAPQAELASANVNPYLLAHQEYSPSVSMRGMTPHVQMVSEVREVAAR